MAKCNRSPRASAHTNMFTYIKFEDGVKAIVNTDDIVDFDIQNILFDKKYQVKWDDGHFYYGILGKMQQKVILEESKEAVDEKIQSRRVEFLPLSLCISATEVNTESDLDRGDDGEDMKNKVTAKIRKLNVQLVKKDNTNNFTSSIENGNNNMKTAKLKNQKLNTFVNVLEKKMPSKEDIKNQKQNEINEIISPATITKSVSKLCSKQNLTDYSIAHDNTKALHASITKGQSCTNKNTARSKSSHKTLHENNNFIATGFKQKTKEILSTKNNHAHLQSKTNQDDILKKKMEKLRKTNEDLETKYLKLKNQMKDKERIINDLINFNMELQSVK
ncbi:putative leucine-rich repeat-containing protein DDB_G0290503 [Linepithema humile]|uniref:putative leucine-rich repeat-containing protein DDB_G0290503 n=1 Tax=Linepithema humile TaxID=83485 RepID=UPI00351EB977